MIQSMTGYGSVAHVENGVSYAVEARSVNHRYLKLTIKVPEHWSYVEASMEQQIRRRLIRGSVTCAFRVRSEVDSGICPLSISAMQSYVDQMAKVRVPAGVQTTIDLGAVSQLPGVSGESEATDEVRAQRTRLVEQVTARALDALVAMRRDEGRVLHDALVQNCESIRAQLAEVGRRAPSVIEEYHERLKTRVETLMQTGGFELQQEGLMREVALFADRCDISEELTRLASHLDQFLEMGNREEPVGRTLDFLTQEMLREANTIASKSNDAAITQSVVEIKGLIDRLKEQVQNVE